MSDQLQLAVTGAPLPENFLGTPQDLFEAMLTRMRVIFPTGQVTFVVSDTEPSTNLGPWLKGGEKWYVWDDDTKRYIPQDISDSLKLIVIADTAPSDGTNPIWLQTKTTVSTSSVRFVRWNVWTGAAWSPLYNRGTTAQRPIDPVEYERYEDLDVGCELVYYGGMWRTVHGSPGDIKQVAWPTLAQALSYNPGWQEIGQFYNSSNVRGRALTACHKDQGVSPAVILPHALGITERAAGDTFGEETHVLSDDEVRATPHQHLVGIRKDPGANDLWLQKSDTTRTFSSALPRDGKYEVLGDGTGAGTLPGDLTDGDLVTSNAVFPATVTPNTGHNTIPPTMAVWTLVKMG